MSKIICGVQLYTLRRYLKKPYNVPEVLRKVKAMGASTVQVSGMCKVDANILNLIAGDIGINICCTHSPFERIKNDLDALAKEHQTYGAKIIGIGMMPKEYRKNNFARLSEFIEILSDASEKLKKYNLKIAYHNHAFEFKERNGKKVYDILIESTPKEVEFIVDTYWLRFANVSIPDYFKKLTGRMTAIHLKDYKKRLGIPFFSELGTGELDFKSILSAAEKSGTKYALIEQDFSLNPYKSVGISMEFLKSNYITL